MRYQQMPAWVYVLPIAIAAVFGIGTLGYMLAGPPNARVFGPISLAMDLIFVLACLRALRGGKSDERVRAAGTPATATLLDAKTTGGYVNHVPEWKLHVRVEGNGAPYETDIRVFTFDPGVNGASFDVRVDPQRRDHVVLAGHDGVVAEVPPPPAAPVAAQVDESGFAATLNPDGSKTYTSN